MSSSSSSSAAAADANRSDSLVHIAFKHDATHFVAATSSGFRVFSCTPLKHVVDKGNIVAPDGYAIEVTSAEVLNESEGSFVFRAVNVDDGSSPGDIINFWSQHSRVLTRKGPCGVVRGIRLLGDYMLVASEEKAMLYELNSHSRERPAKTAETGPNPLGLCALAQPDDQFRHRLVYAYPRPEKGVVQIRWRGGGYVDVHAHSSSVACLALSRDGRLLATASSKGTLVRVFGAIDGKMLQELRRGRDRADIHCIAFSPDSRWLAVSSDKATVHVFSVNVDPAIFTPEDDDGLQPPTLPSLAPARANQGSSLSFLGGYLPSYFSSEWSLAQFRLREGTKHLVAFGQQPNTVIIIGMDGSFHRCQFDPEKEGEMKLLEYRDFMKLPLQK